MMLAMKNIACTTHPTPARIRRWGWESFTIFGGFYPHLALRSNPADAPPGTAALPAAASRAASAAGLARHAAWKAAVQVTGYAMTPSAATS